VTSIALKGFFALAVNLRQLLCPLLSLANWWADKWMDWWAGELVGWEWDE